MNIGVSTACLYPLETEAALEKIGAAGIKTTELFFNSELEFKESFTDMLVGIRDRYVIKIPTVHTAMSLAESFMIFSAYERRFYESLDNFKRYSAAAAKLGAKYIVMHGGKPNGITTDEEYCERYMALKEVTRSNGVSLLQENVRGFRSADEEFLCSMRDILGSEAELCFDIKQSIRNGYLPMEQIEKLFPNIKHFHISDHNISSDCLLPGAGKFDFEGFAGFLKDNGYNGSCMIEVYEHSFGEFSEITAAYNSLLKIFN